ncbi:MAG: hypothetical protein ACI8QS_001480 [Planctomycetota bacterium]|jgi:hypothetical protein
MRIGIVTVTCLVALSCRALPDEEPLELHHSPVELEPESQLSEPNDFEGSPVPALRFRSSSVYAEANPKEGRTAFKGEYCARPGRVMELSLFFSNPDWEPLLTIDEELAISPLYEDFEDITFVLGEESLVQWPVATGIIWVGNMRTCQAVFQFLDPLGNAGKKNALFSTSYRGNLRTIRWPVDGKRAQGVFDPRSRLRYDPYPTD